MANFYNTSSGAGDTNSSGFYNGGGGSGGSNSGAGIYGQSQSQQQQQQSGFTPSMSQWQTPSSAPQQQPQQSMPQNASQQGTGQQMMYGQSSLQQQQQQSSQSSFFSGFQQQGTQVATKLVTDFATGNLTSEKIGEKVLDGIGKGFGGGIPGLEYVMQSLRGYFAVDNRYVKRKMAKVLFPFLNKQWQRVQSYEADTITYALPNADENAPDLYLPVMSLITYGLLCALCYGTAGEFNPEVIADVTTKCFATQIFEVLVFRLGFYMLQSPIALLDLFAYTGYKYLGLTMNILFGILFGFMENWGRTGFYITFLWTASAASFFMLKTMANNVPKETSHSGPKRELMVLGFAASQFFTMWLVSQTKFL